MPDRQFAILMPILPHDKSHFDIETDEFKKNINNYLERAYWPRSNVFSTLDDARTANTKRRDKNIIVEFEWLDEEKKQMQLHSLTQDISLNRKGNYKLEPSIIIYPRRDRSFGDTTVIHLEQGFPEKLDKFDVLSKDIKDKVFNAVKLDQVKSLLAESSNKTLDSLKGDNEEKIKKHSKKYQTLVDIRDELNKVFVFKNSAECEASKTKIYDLLNQLIKQSKVHLSFFRTGKVEGAAKEVLKDHADFFNVPQQPQKHL